MNNELLFKDKSINDLKNKLRLSFDLINYYKQQYDSLLKQATEDRKANTKIVARFLKRKQQKI